MKKQVLLVIFLWFGVCLLGTLPYYFSGFFPDFTDALFESVSGFTTTGATVLADIEELPVWLLLWRAATQWFGGMGILLTVTMLPFFSSDGYKRGKKARILLLIYTALTALQFVLLVIFGMNLFDALTHSFSTMSTGGFSIRNNGAAYYNSPAVEWVSTGFMFLAGINLYMIWLILRGKAANVIRNSEVKVYTGIVLIASGLIVFMNTQSFSETAIRQAFFHVTSLISTSGFYTADYNKWTPAAQGVLFFLLFTGGCLGSVAGGVKIFRYVILSKQAWIEMKRLVYHRGVFNIQLNKRSGNKKAVYRIAGFVFLYFFILFLAALLVSSSGADVFTSLNTAVICLGNIGRGLGETGAFMPFPALPAYVKWGLCLTMIMGRLELQIVLALFTKDFWRG
jgi:trk system potassium uptake protein TrkH